MNTKKIIKKKFFVISSLVIVIAVIAAAFLFMPQIIGQYIKIFGVTLAPDYDIKPLYDKVYLQTDERWKNEYLADTEYTLGEQGCLTCVIAADLCYLGYDVLPDEVNKDFKESGAYTESGELIWYKISDTYSGTEYEYKKAFSSADIMKDLEEGLLPIIKVKYKKTGIYHWVMIVGADEGEFYIIDPLEQSEGIIPLSTHGKAYAYRVIKKTE